MSDDDAMVLTIVSIEDYTSNWDFKNAMIKKVWKYPVTTDDKFTLYLPENAEPLTVQPQNGELCMWVLVDPDAPTNARTFRLAGTGHPIYIEEGQRLDFVGTVQGYGGALVFHIFEVVTTPPQVKSEAP